MAWHIGCLDTSCVPFANLDIILRKLCAASNGNIKKCLFFAGEIDCRNQSIVTAAPYLLTKILKMLLIKLLKSLWKVCGSYRINMDLNFTLLP